MHLSSLVVTFSCCIVSRSLRNADSSLVVSACEFLSDVVFQDFPAEVFLQRPYIVKVPSSLLFKLTVTLET